MEYIVNLIIYMGKSGLIESLNDTLTISCKCCEGAALLSMQIRSVHLYYFIGFKFYSWVPLCLLDCFPVTPTIGAKIHQTSILVAREWCPWQRLRFILQAGRQLSPTEELQVLCPVFPLQWWFQSYLAESHPGTLKNHVYTFGRHISLEWLLGTHQKNSSSDAFIMSAESTVSLKSKTSLPCTTGRVM